MTTPPAPQPPAPQPPPGQQPPDGGQQGQGQPPAPPAPAGQDGDQPGARYEAALAEERAARIRAEQALTELRKTAMSDADRKIAEARDEGRREAAEEHAKQLAAEMFRAAAAGRLADPDAHLEAMDLGKLLSDGQPSRRKITALVDRLGAPPPPAQPPGRVPAGARGGAADDGDFFRQAMR